VISAIEYERLGTIIYRFIVRRALHLQTLGVVALPRPPCRTHDWGYHCSGGTTSLVRYTEHSRNSAPSFSLQVWWSTDRRVGSQISSNAHLTFHPVVLFEVHDAGLTASPKRYTTRKQASSLLSVSYRLTNIYTVASHGGPPQHAIYRGDSAGVMATASLPPQSAEAQVRPAAVSQLSSRPSISTHRLHKRRTTVPRTGPPFPRRWLPPRRGEGP
jgi:hypothetical protein